MRVLRYGYNGYDVQEWKYFLIGMGYSILDDDLHFDDDLRRSTVEFQKRYKLSPDGVVGPKTYGMAMQLGFDPTEEERTDKLSSNWPPKPTFSPLFNTQSRELLFGSFPYEPMPTAHNPEGIRILNDWAQKNILRVHIPQLAHVSGSPKKCDIWMHKKAIPSLKRLWERWEEEGLLHLIRTWNGGYVPRFIRGSKRYLSNHAFGTAFDINAQWNRLGARPPLVGDEGSVRELVPIANELGWYWGGHYTGRKDGMHFELSHIDKK